MAVRFADKPTMAFVGSRRLSFATSRGAVAVACSAAVTGLSAAGWLFQQPGFEGVLVVIPVLVAAVLLGPWLAGGICLLAIGVEAFCVANLNESPGMAVISALTLISVASIGMLGRHYAGIDTTGLLAPRGSAGAHGSDSSVGSQEQPASEAVETQSPAGLRGVEVLGRHILNEDEFSRRTAALSHRQREVVRLAISGLTAARIGVRLFISERTVETHMANAYERLGVHSRSELIARLQGPVAEVD